MAVVKDPSKWKFETKQVHSGQEIPETTYGARAVPIYQTTAYVFDDTAQATARFELTDDGDIYARITNPTLRILEKRIAALEGGTGALAVASGAAAANYVFQMLAHAGDHIVSESTIYGGTYNLLRHTLSAYGIETTFVDPETADQIGAFERALRPNTKALYIETLGNPNSNVVDIEGLADLAHRHGVPLVVDATFTPPNLINTKDYGADIIIHSASKYINGHGTGLGGLIVECGGFDWAAAGKFPQLTKPSESYHGIVFSEIAPEAPCVNAIRAVLLRDTGAAMAPFNAFLMLQGLETLSLRVERHIENTMKILDYLGSQPKVKAIHHPSLETEASHILYEKYFPKGAGSIFTFEYDGTEEEAKAFIDRLEIFSLLANVADAKSLVVHPASTTHSQLSRKELEEQHIYPNTIRLSIGIENVGDLIEDLKQAFGS